MSGISVRAVAVAAGVLAAVVGLGVAAYAGGAVGGVRSTGSTTLSATAAENDVPGATVPTPTGRAAPDAPTAPDPSPTAPHPSPTDPRTAPSTPPRTTPAVTPVDCARGERQRDVEIALVSIGGYGPIVADGVQSPGDCAAIKRFQQRFGIYPINGRADATTADVARRIAVSLSAPEQAKCGASSGLTACVDLSQQTVWVVRDGGVVFGPTVVRTGYRGYATPAGTFTINRRAIREWSRPYDVWLPYWQHFHQGMGFHETATYLHNPALGSHGCVNLLAADAVQMWHLLANGTTVRTFGRRVGT